MIKKFLEFLNEDSKEIEFPKSFIIDKFLTNFRIQSKNLKMNVMNIVQLDDKSFDIDVDSEEYGLLSIHFLYENGISNIDIYKTKTKESLESCNNKMSFEKGLKKISDFFDFEDLLEKNVR